MLIISTPHAIIHLFVLRRAPACELGPQMQIILMYHVCSVTNKDMHCPAAATPNTPGAADSSLFFSSILTLIQTSDVLFYSVTDATLNFGKYITCDR